MVPSFLSPLLCFIPSSFGSYSPHAEAQLWGAVGKLSHHLWHMTKMYLKNNRNPFLHWMGELCGAVLSACCRLRLLFGSVRHSLQGHGIAGLQQGGGRIVASIIPSRHFWGLLQSSSLPLEPKLSFLVSLPQI